MGKDESTLKDLLMGDLVNLARWRSSVWLVEPTCDACLGGCFQGQGPQGSAGWILSSHLIVWGRPGWRKCVPEADIRAMLSPLVFL